MNAQARSAPAEVLLGVTLATPFLANLIPYPLLLGLAAAPAGLGLILVTRAPRDGLNGLAKGALGNPVALLLWLILAFQFLGVLQSSDPLAPRLLRDLTAGFALAVIASAAPGIAPSRAASMRVLMAFLGALVALAAASSILGLAKLFLLERGIVLKILQWFYPVEYPWGSSLKRDYNFFALSILIGMLALTEIWFHSERPLERHLLSALLGAMAVAGAYAGSRRFWLVAPLVLGAQFAFVWWRGRGQAAASRRWLGLIAVAAIVGAGLLQLIDSARDIDFAVLDQLFQGQSVTDPGYRSAREAIGADFRSRASMLASSSESFGIASRLDRWRYALELVDWRTLFVGAGFDYHQSFGCRFLECQDIDYPHSAILSSLLYGGVGALLVSIAYVGLILVLGFRLVRQGGAAVTAGLALVTAFPFFMISGDSFSSLPGLTALAILGSMLTGPRAAG